MRTMALALKPKGLVTGLQAPEVLLIKYLNYFHGSNVEAFKVLASLLLDIFNTLHIITQTTLGTFVDKQSLTGLG